MAAIVGTSMENEAASVKQRRLQARQVLTKLSNEVGKLKLLSI